MSAVKITITALLADSTVTGLVGARIRPMQALQNDTMPNIVVYRVSSGDEYTLAGAGQYEQSRVTVESRGNTYKSADELATAVVSALRDLSGDIDGYETTFFKDGSDFDTFEPDFNTHRRAVDFQVRWRVAS